MLKKQTVWLLTMLSLMIVLSVYYMISPNSEDLAYIDSGQEYEEASSNAIEKEADTEEADASESISGNELFTTIRMEIQDDRSMSKSRLEEVVASSTASVQEKDQALREIDELENISKKEKILEETILSSADYQDVLVRSEDDKVHVHVQANELSETEANHIMRMVYDEFGDVPVDVIIQPTDNE